MKTGSKVPPMRPMQVGSGKRGPSFDEGSLDQYLREISKYPLIPQEEEVSLAQRIRAGEGEALDKLVRSNLRFVVSLAKTTSCSITCPTPRTPGPTPRPSSTRSPSPSRKCSLP